MVRDVCVFSGGTVVLISDMLDADADNAGAQSEFKTMAVALAVSGFFGVIIRRRERAARRARRAAQNDKGK